MEGRLEFVEITTKAACTHGKFVDKSVTFGDDL